MTDHLEFDYQCVCGTHYIPFSEEQRNCPKCKTPAPEVVPLVPRIVRAANYNKNWPVFAVLSLGDHYIIMATHIIRSADKAEKISAENLESICEKLTGSFRFEGNEHLRDHTKAFVRAVLQEAYLKV